MSHAAPLVSICIPVYNGARFIADTIQSVLAQDYANFECVISDNASTDNTRDIVQRFHDRRIIYSRSEHNVGAIGNFNRCLDLAQGIYTKIVCADDLIYPECVSRQVAILEQDTERRIALVSCARDIIDEKGKIRFKTRVKNFSGRIAADEAIRRTIRQGTNIFCEPHAILFRTEQARAVGGFRPDHGFCLDMDFAFHLLRLGDLYRLDDVLSAFRVSTTSWSASVSNIQHREFRRFVEDFDAHGWMKIPVRDQQRGIRNAVKLAYQRRLFYLWLSVSKWFSR